MLLPEDQTTPHKNLLRSQLERDRDGECEIDDITDSSFKIGDVEMSIDYSCELVGCRHDKIEASEFRNMRLYLLMLGR